MKNALITGCLMLATFTGYSQPAQNDEQLFVTIENINAPTLGYSSTSGVSILKVKGLNFKDLNRNGKLDAYEDWHLVFPSKNLFEKVITIKGNRIKKKVPRRVQKMQSLAPVRHFFTRGNDSLALCNCFLMRLP